MILRIILSGKFGRNYHSMDLYTTLDNNGNFRIAFPKDLDYTKPFTMICEPSEALKKEIEKEQTE